MASVEDKVKALESQTEKQKTLNAELEAGLVALQQENTNRAQENKQLLEVRPTTHACSASVPVLYAASRTTRPVALIARPEFLFTQPDSPPYA